MSAQGETTARRAAGARLGTFERYLSVWVARCIVAGMALGQVRQHVRGVFAPWLPAQQLDS